MSLVSIGRSPGSLRETLRLDDVDNIAIAALGVYHETRCNALSLPPGVRFQAHEVIR
jgi:hypothetical protein